MNRELFDTNKLDDIPPDLLPELNLCSKNDTAILSLFHKAGGALGLTELLVGYYREYGLTKTRNYMMVTCYRMVKKGWLSPTGKGHYHITSKGLFLIGERNGKCWF